MNKNIKMLERISPGLWRGSDYIYQKKKKKRWAVLKNKEEGKGFGREKNKRMWTPVSLRGMRSRKGICDWSSVLDCSSNLVWVISAFMLFHNTPARALHHKATRYSNPPPPHSLHLFITVTNAVLNTHNLHQNQIAQAVRRKWLTKAQKNPKHLLPSCLYITRIKQVKYIRRCRSVHVTCSCISSAEI